MLANARWVIQTFQNPTQRKHIIRWLRSLKSDYLLQKKQPWLTFDAIDFLDSLPLENKQVFEYGSGGSTLFWIQHGAHVTSIEHDSSWYDKLRECCLEDALIDYRLVPPEPLDFENSDIANPDAYASDDRAFTHSSFQRYCSQIDEFPDNSFDVVLVDGRARPSCIKHSVKKVKVNGYLVLDNSNRGYYLQQTSSLLLNYERKIYTGATPGQRWNTETSVFLRKPPFKLAG